MVKDKLINGRLGYFMFHTTPAMFIQFIEMEIIHFDPDIYTFIENQINLEAQLAYGITPN
ncbi:MAG: hypothetical protein MZV64_08615 [Ignavibacteriales bacterium]|nr:hypothetical protein [Ignavibacteriales bacterium]